MHISHVSAKNLKGRTFEHALSKKMLIVGPNFTGKTAVLDAIRLALKGNIPEIGLKNSATFELSSGTVMTAGVTFDDGTKQFRILKIKDGSVSLDVDGADDYDTPMLDAAAYFGMTERDRIDYVFRQVTMPEGLTPSGIIARLERIGFGDEHSTAIEEAKRDVLETIRPEFEGDVTVADALTALTGTILPAEFRTANTRAKDMAGAERTLAELKIEAGHVTADTLADLRNKQEAAQTILSEANTELGRLEAKRTGSKTVADRKKEIITALQAGGPELMRVSPAPENSERIVVASAKIDELRAMPAVEQPSDAALQAARTAYGEASGAAARATVERQKVEAELEDAKHLKACPHCGGKAKNWNRTLLANLEVKVSFARAAEADLTAKLEPLADAGRKAKTQYDEACKAHEGYLGVLGSIQSLTREIEVAQQEEKAWAQLSKQAEQSNQQTKARHAARITELNKELETLEDVEPPTESEIVAAGLASADARSRLNAIGDQVRQAERLQRDLQLAQQANDKYQVAAAKVVVLNAFKSDLLEVKGEMVATAFQELLKVANDIVGDILPSPLAFNEDTGEVGRWGRSGFIGHKTFSGTEKALAYVAVAAALSSKAKLRALPLDELGRLTPDLQDKVLEALSKAVDAGKLDQVIAVIPKDVEASRAWTGLHLDYMIIRTDK